MLHPQPALITDASGQKGLPVTLTPSPKPLESSMLSVQSPGDWQQDGNEQERVACSSSFAQPASAGTEGPKGQVSTLGAKGADTHSSTEGSEGPGLETEEAEVFGVAYAEGLSEKDAELTTVRFVRPLAVTCTS
jgi:hypothetical protein